MSENTETKTATLIFKGLTFKQAKTFAKWYEGQGEQDADVWFDIQEVKTPMVDCRKKYLVDEQTETLTVFCK